ncbi:MAG: hypothetical protein ACKN9A_11500 [Microcystis aeruginosa]
MRSPQLIVLLLGLSFLPSISPSFVHANPSIVQVKQSSNRNGGQKISEAEIKAMIQDIETAIKDKNIPLILKHYAPFISSQLTIKTDASTEIFELDGITEHKIFLEESYKNIKSIEVLSENWDVDILANNEMAIITRERVVNITNTEGDNYIVASEAVAKVAPIDGKLRIFSIQETAEVGRRPNK